MSKCHFAGWTCRIPRRPVKLSVRILLPLSKIYCVVTTFGNYPSTPAETVTEESPVKKGPVKFLLPGEKNLDFLPLQCILSGP